MKIEDVIDQAPPGEEEAEEYYQPGTSEDIIAEHEKQEAKEEPSIVLPGLTSGVVPGGVTGCSRRSFARDGFVL